eukprot:superscaffoldBa00000029_g566
MSEFLVSLLGERLVNSEKAEVDVQSLGAKLSLVGLFFGCSLNAPCKQFNASLCEFYSRFKKASEHKDNLEIVFISSDQDQKHWHDFLQEMPWPALPFKDRHKKPITFSPLPSSLNSLPLQHVQCNGGGGQDGMEDWKGCSLDTFEVVSGMRMMAKLWAILDNASHPLYEYLCALGSSLSNRLLHPRCSKERFCRSFLPEAITLYNSSHHCSQRSQQYH